jgi:hypothetical protein
MRRSVSENLRDTTNERPLGQVFHGNSPSRDITISGVMGASCRQIGCPAIPRQPQRRSGARGHHGGSGYSFIQLARSSSLYPSSRVAWTRLPVSA